MDNSEVFDIMIVGAGAAGLSAGIYSSRAKLKTLILNEGAVGGQMVLTHEIANYPGVESISGFALAGIMKNRPAISDAPSNQTSGSSVMP